MNVNRDSARHAGLQTRQVKITVERYADCYVAYPLGLKGVVVGEGSYQDALADVTSASRFHLDTFGPEVLPG